MAYAQLARKRWGLSAGKAQKPAGRGAVFIKHTAVVSQPVGVSCRSNKFSIPDVKFEQNSFIGPGAKSQSKIGLLALFFMPLKAQNISKRTPL